ncbi:MAG: zinc ribbon domain-containing protein [Longimicrobiales bacterium]
MEVAIIVTLVIAAFAAVALPVLRGGAHGVADLGDAATIEQEVLRYRAALRSDGVCRRCGQANPDRSRFCYECGRSLPAGDREEFDGTGDVA